MKIEVLVQEITPMHSAATGAAARPELIASVGKQAVKATNAAQAKAAATKAATEAKEDSGFHY